MPEPLLFPVTHGAEAPERATVPHIAAATAAASGQRAIVIATIEGATLALPDVVATVAEEGMPAVADLQRTLVDGGGEIWVCSACAVKRGMDGDTELVPGATIVGAATIVEALASGRALTLG